MTFIAIPQDGVSKELREEIESKLPEPQKVPGWKFVGYRWRKLTQINTKDKNGNTDNTVRNSGTGDSEQLQISLKKGIDVTKLTPSIYPNNNLINGFNRHKNLLSLGYREWIFAEYVEDESSRTEFQENFEESLDDFRAAANKGDGQKVISDSEVEELGRKRFRNRQDRSKSKITEWIRTLDLNWSSQKIEAISKRISLDFERKGVIESYNRNEAQSYLTKFGIGADLLNTTGAKGDNTRVLRQYQQIMENFIKNKSTFEIVLFDSQVASHEDADKRRKETIEFLKELDQMVVEYTAARFTCQGVNPWNVKGAIPQKIGGEKANSSGLVELNVN